MPTARSSQTTRPPFPPRRPGGTSDDPFTIADYVDEDEEDDPGRLKGDPPGFFDGDRRNTAKFLTEFKRFMMNNQGARIAKDPLKKATYFLSLIRGQHVDGWKMRMYDWLDKVEADPTKLPFGMNAWQTLERKFEDSFEDYAGKEYAQLDLQQLCMKDGRVDEYIDAFEQLLPRAGMNPDHLGTLHLFARGLPREIAYACIDKDSPENFQEWAKAAQRQQRIYLKKQAILGDYYFAPQPQRSGATPPPSPSRPKRDGHKHRRAAQ